jgi:esterase/lipase
MVDKVPHFAERLKQKHAPADWKNVVSKTRKMIKQLGHAPEWTPGVNFIHNPVRLLLGGRDNMVSADETRKVAYNLPNASIKILTGMEHPLEKVDFDILTDEIQAFFNEKI